MSLDYVSHLIVESQRFLDVLRAGPADRAVPSCPDWTAADLLWHLGGDVQHFWAQIVSSRLTHPSQVEELERPESYDGLIAAAERALADLVESLRGAEDHEEVWTWFSADQSVGFVRRRQAHEAFIHRIDAERCMGVESHPIDVNLAADGALEVLELYFAGLPEWADLSTPGDAGTIHLTDTGHTWTVRVDSWCGTSPNTGTVYTDEPVLTLLQGAEAEGVESTFSITGTAVDMNLWLWSRGPADSLTITGDAEPPASAVAIFEKIVALGIE